jgi:hypothetical protein
MFDNQKFTAYTQDDVRVIACLEKFKEHKFGVTKQIDENSAVYDLKWTENRLSALELLDEGEIKFNGRIQINRKYVCGKTNESSFYDHYTLVQDTSIEKKLGVIGIVHGFGQCSDTFMET